MPTHPWAALKAAATAWPDKPALIFPHEQREISFSEWRDWAARIATDLRLAPGDHVALLAENRLVWPVIQMAVAAAGAVFVPLNTHYRAGDLGQALIAGDIDVLISSRQFRSNHYEQTLAEIRGQLDNLKQLVWIDSLEQRCAPSVLTLDPQPSDSPGAMLYTSGTTGAPKAALLSHRAMMLNAGVSAHRLGLVPGDRWTSMIPLFHCAGCIMNLLGCVQTGAAYVGLPSFDPGQVFSTIESQRCTHFSGVPTAYLSMLNHPERHQFNLDTLRAGTCGGADANPDILAACARELPIPGLVQVYGQTESGTLMSCAHTTSADRFSTAGPALDGYEIRIVDPLTGEPRATGDVGEIQGRGPMTMDGYYANPAATAETLVDGWLRTGDLGYLDANNNLVIAGGRLRDMIIRGGENIYPAEIEQHLITLSSIDEVAVFAVPDSYYGECVGAAIRSSSPPDRETIQKHCRETLAGFKVPTRLYQVDGFPLTSSGKIRKVELRELASNGLLKELK